MSHHLKKILISTFIPFPFLSCTVELSGALPQENFLAAVEEEEEEESQTFDLEGERKEGSDNNDSPVVRMIDYFNSLKNNQEILSSADKEEALGIIVDCLVHDPEGATPIENVLFAKSKSKTAL